MRVQIIACAAALAFAAPYAALAKDVHICVTETLSCATTMPVGGYCECHGKGTVEGGEVQIKAPAGRHVNATAGGCGAHPDAPGCK